MSMKKPGINIRPRGAKKAGAAPPAKKGAKIPVKAGNEALSVSVAKLEPEAQPEVAQTAQETKTTSVVVEPVEAKTEVKVESSSVTERTEAKANGNGKDGFGAPAGTAEKVKEPETLPAKTKTLGIKKKVSPKKAAASITIETKEVTKTVDVKESESIKSVPREKAEEANVEAIIEKKETPREEHVNVESDLPTEVEVEEVAVDEEMEENGTEDELVGEEEDQREERVDLDEDMENEGMDEEENEGDDAEEEEEEGGEEEVEEEAAEENLEVHEPPPVTERQKRRKFEVFVGGLDKDATEEDVKKAFEKVGEVMEVRLMKNSQTGKNKGYAFIRFATVDQAKRAATELARTQVRGKLCGVVPSEDNDILFLGNISRSWKREQVLETLKEYGIEGIEEMNLMEDPQNEGMNRGFAFLELATHNDAVRAFKRLQRPDAVFGSDRSAKIAWAEPLNEPDDEVMSQVKSVFVDGLPANWDENKVREHFAKYGEIERIVMARNMSSARRKDFGFVNYVTREGAVACIEAFKVTDHLTDGETKIKVRIELSKPQQKAKAVKGGVHGNYPLGGAGRGLAYAGQLDTRKPGRGGRGIARGGGRAGGRGGKHFYDEPSVHWMRGLRQQAEERLPPPFERSRDRRALGPGISRPARAPPRGGYSRPNDPYFSRGSHFGRSSYEYPLQRGGSSRRGSLRGDYSSPREAGLSPGLPRARNSYPGRNSLPPQRDGRYSRRADRGHTYARGGGYSSVAHEYHEAGPGMKRTLSAMNDDPGYYESGSRGYPRPRIDYADPVSFGGASHYADSVRAPPLGRSPHGVGAGGRTALAPSVPQSSLSIYDSGAGLSGGSSSLYATGSHGYGATLSGASDYLSSAAEIRGTSSLYGSRSGSGGYGLPGAGSGSYY